LKSTTSNSGNLSAIRRIDTLDNMYYRCTHCGYDNIPEHRFCGMCGVSLANPAALIEPKGLPSERGERPSDRLHGPSFLGLADDPKSEFHYLYEDEQPRSHVGLIVLFVLLIAAVGVDAYWQWRHGGFPFNRPIASGFARQPVPAAPSAGQNQPTPTGQNATSDRVKNVESSSQAVSSGSTAPELMPPVTAQEEQEAAEPIPPPERSVKSRARNPKYALPLKQAAKSASAVPVVKPPITPDADLEAAGEQYLYGTGVVQNCSRAESNLRFAAMHGNRKSQAVLGTKYFTGHCVARDLPTAYRWFERAVRRDPQNLILSRDIQLLWRQMSTKERQLAISEAR
jgi:hypothetical protein